MSGPPESPKQTPPLPWEGFAVSLMNSPLADVVALNQFAWCEEAAEGEDLARLAAAANESLHAVADDVHGRAHRERIDQTGRRQRRERARVLGAASSITATS